MKRILLIVIAAMMVPFLAMAKKDDVISYQVEGAGTGAQGTYLVKTTVVTKNKNISEELIGRSAVHGVLFKGFSNADTRQHQKPLAGSPTVEQEHIDFFSAFFADGGDYINYVQVISNSRTVVKAGKEYKVSATVTVSKDQLRKDLENNGIIKGLNSGF